MNLLDYLTINNIRAPLLAGDKRGAIDELVDVLAGTGRVPDPKALKEAVWVREQTRTTGIGSGLAIPHGKCPGLPGLIMAVGKPAKPMNFESIDGQPVRLIFLLGSPPEKGSDHIQALARVSRLMTMDSFRERMYAATATAEIYDLLKSQERPG
ncbi:MAG: PTS sugar transporter subunit IIA [Phycisphaerales bacterium]|nr:PTS sugar transporter subunit IIA [Phycisphaerales bacterium]